MIDCALRRLIIYDFENENYPLIRGGSGKVPVGIYKGRLEIDLDAVAVESRDYTE